MVSNRFHLKSFKLFPLSLSFTNKVKYVVEITCYCIWLRVLTKVLKGIKLIFPLLRPLKVLNLDIFFIKGLDFK